MADWVSGVAKRYRVPLLCVVRLPIVAAVRIGEPGDFNPSTYCQRREQMGKDMSCLKSSSARMPPTERSVANVFKQIHLLIQERGNISHSVRLQNLLTQSHPKTIESWYLLPLSYWRAIANLFSSHSYAFDIAVSYASVFMPAVHGSTAL